MPHNCRSPIEIKTKRKSINTTTKFSSESDIVEMLRMLFMFFLGPVSCQKPLSVGQSVESP